MNNILEIIKTNSSIVGGHIINDSSRTENRITTISEKQNDYIQDNMGGGDITELKEKYE